MPNYKKVILDKLCYTELVYGRINKKLKIDLSKDKIEELITTVILETDENKFIKTGKNIYITNEKRKSKCLFSFFCRIFIEKWASKHD